jgi:metallopeptidase MepB
MTQPTLLRHHQLISLFHELGHSIHYLLGRTKFAATYGTSTSKDFVEIPSKMLENWCWVPEILQRLSTHYSNLSPQYADAWKEENPYSASLPPEKAPMELLHRLVATRKFNVATNTQKQLHLAIFDNVIHSTNSVADVRAMNMGKLYNEIRRDVTGLLGPETGRGADWGWGCGHTRFEHLFIGYDAGYYCYSM